MLIFAGACLSLAQDRGAQPSVLHIQQSVTTSRPGFPQYLYTYQVLGGAQSSAVALALEGTISLKNITPTFSEVLWLLAYWKGKCPENDQRLLGANFIWSDILKNPALADSDLHIDLQFPHPLPMTGCVGLVFAGGPLLEGGSTMSADLNLTYQASPPIANTVLDVSGEYCFGQSWGCQNATPDDAMGFGVPVQLPAGHLVELFGDISDSTFDGTRYYGPLPSGKSWGAINDFYLLPGGCGQFGQNLNNMGFPNPALLSAMYGWLPDNAVLLASVPLEYEIPQGQSKAALQSTVEKIFPTPVAVNAGDCLVVIYGRSGDGATDNETQVHALMAP